MTTPLKTTKLSVRVNPDEHCRLRELAARERLSVATLLVRSALKNAESAHS